MSRSFLFCLLIGFCGGLILAEFWVGSSRLLATAFLSLLIASIFSRTRLVGVLGLALIIGLVRFQAWTAVSDTALERQYDQAISISGTVMDIPSESFGKQKIELGYLVYQQHEVSGKVSMSLPLFPAQQLGQRLTINCRLMKFGDSYWRQRLHDVRGYCQDIDVIESQTGKKTFRLRLTGLKGRALEIISSHVVEPQSSLLIGILMGRQVPMPEELGQAFQATGTTHIIALSGFNVTIIIAALTALLVRLVGRRWSWLVAIGCVTSFIVMTGASSSVTRAGVMSGIVLIVGRLGRRVSMIRVLSLTILIMTWFNPLVLRHDLGFQLSFLATIGLLYASKPMERILQWFPNIMSSRENLGTTLAAMVLTEPLLLWTFGRASLIAPAVNMIVLPFIPIIMAIGFVAVVLSWIWEPLGVLVWPLTDILLRGVLSIIQSAASLPFAAQTIDGWMMVILAGVLGAAAISLFLVQHEEKTTTVAR